MSTIDRVVRHARISWQNLALSEVPSPPFLILFINSICNLTCEHCFYWKNLNQRDDLTVDEIFSLSNELGRIENLNLSGGEPFIRKEFAEICRHFIQRNKVEQIYVPTNGYYVKKTVDAISDVLKETSLKLFAAEISLDGMPEFHNRFRGSDRSFQYAMETYEALTELQKQDSRLRIHSISTATADNMDEIRRLTTYLYERCPAIDHHNIALIRGDRKNPTLQGPKLREYQELLSYQSRLWAPREQGRFGGIVEPMLQWAKLRTAEEQRQVVPCRAGVLSGVVYANGDVAVCENHPPSGNLRKNTFWEIWNSEEARKLRQSIANKACYCTNEVFLWPSIVYQPTKLAQAMAGAKVWQKAKPLGPNEKVELSAEDDVPAIETARRKAAGTQVSPPQH
jgi:MoaA/NifB/PqqE/SkfB family radical SAM enzyme